jgi:hypothetical protein
LAIGEVEEQRTAEGKQEIHVGHLSYFSRLTDAESKRMLDSDCLLASQGVPAGGFVVPSSSLLSLPQIFEGIPNGLHRPFRPAPVILSATKDLSFKDLRFKPEREGSK